MAEAGIVGASGYTGGELLRILSSHPEVEISFVTAKRSVGSYVHKVHPNLRRVARMRFDDFDPENLQDCDVLFLALPHGSSMNFAETLLDRGLRIIDLSADFRLKDPADYREWYGMEHKSPKLLSKSVYGLTELYREQIKDASLVAGPGCIPTSTILALAPLIGEVDFDLEKIVVDVKIGSSASGNKPVDYTHHPERSGVVRAYKPTGHRHIAEIEQVLNSLSKSRTRISLSAHAVEMIRGIFTTIHLFLDEPLEDRDVWKLYRKSYVDEPFIRVFREKKGIHRLPDPKIVRGTNFCDIGFVLDEHVNRLVVLSALDNLVKGAAGQAVQDMNVMLGIEERTGLEFPGLHP